MNLERRGTKRNAALDYARLIAAIGIIVFHVGAPGAAVGYAALPFFLMLLLILAFPAALRQDFASYARSRASRLIWPWLTWSLVYGALKAAEVILGGKTVSSEFMPWMLLTGPALHLWFLPFAFIACIAMWPLARRFQSLQILGRTVCTVLGLSLSVSILMATQDRVAPPSLNGCMLSLQSSLGMFLLFLQTCRGPFCQRHWRLAACVVFSCSWIGPKVRCSFSWQAGPL